MINGISKMLYYRSLSIKSVVWKYNTIVVQNANRRSCTLKNVAHELYFSLTYTKLHSNYVQIFRMRYFTSNIYLRKLKHGYISFKIEKKNYTALLTNIYFENRPVKV